MNEQPKRRAKRTTDFGLPGDSDGQGANKGPVLVGPRSNKRKRRRFDAKRRLLSDRSKDRLRKVLGAMGVATVFALVIYVGAAVTYAAFQPPMAQLKVVQTTWVARGVPTFAPTVTDAPTRTPTPILVPTSTPIRIPSPPKWVTNTLMTRYAGIVMGETWSITDTEAMIFLATQIMYDAEAGKGRLPTNRWKAYKSPTHESLQAVNVALVRMLLKDPKYPKCDYVGGFNDTNYFTRVSKYRVPDYTFGAGTHVVLGWGCIPESVKRQ